MTDATEHELAEWPFDPAAVWRSRSTDELFADALPWTGDESFLIDDLTDEESDAFWAAVGE